MIMSISFTMRILIEFLVFLACGFTHAQNPQVCGNLGSRLYCYDPQECAICQSPDRPQRPPYLVCFDPARKDLCYDDSTTCYCPYLSRPRRNSQRTSESGEGALRIAEYPISDEAISSSPTIPTDFIPTDFKLPSNSPSTSGDTGFAEINGGLSTTTWGEQPVAAAEPDKIYTPPYGQPIAWNFG